MDITLEDGSIETINSAETFKFSYDGPYRYTDLFTGVKYDARMEKDDYSVAGFDDSTWINVQVKDYDKQRLFAQSHPIKRPITNV
ncbi:alpha-L-rhamnosidase N-terminal domain-containing protein [Paenibacillus sp. UASWS1643]|uniref:alpha-L-rhamnosidase N-terminal domain-containing protein n=1 Tax=Paenibacillus sp. UASWS1643 TaxID=2580422 RepID=UPI00123AE5E0|nr:alpha-L-rhamnosidase N-terminal domain-containing protein [Paenibacillus sp. UASWS1643]KAA8746149.1 hypothetical protein FE296_30550 [Paenibacillus sp. UASWS1643]